MSTNRNVSIAKGGFSRLKPFLTSVQKKKHSKPLKTLTDPFHQFILDKGPFDFFITVTFGKSMAVARLCRYLNKLLDRYNQILYTRKYKERNMYIEGFAFLEKHLSSVARNEYHFHLLIKCPEKYEKHTLSQHEDIFRKAASRVTDDRDRRVFNQKCIDITPYRDEGAIRYCMEQIHDFRLERIKFISKDGLSDNMADGW
jgi:hypothetical protein